MQAFKFKHNRIRRSYIGGIGIDRIRNVVSPVDGEYPEDWIASTIAAFTRPGEPDDAGISIIADESNRKFPELLDLYSEELLGPEHVARFGANTGFLMKLLDSAIRLPVQSHPNKFNATRLFGSGYGKTEAWFVLATRTINGEEPYLMIGFNDKLDKEQFIRESVSGHLEHGLDMIHKVAVKPGDIFMIPGGVPHAIGPGLTIIEIMEPSDWIVISEDSCGNIALDESRRFNNLPPLKAMEMYEFNQVSYAELLTRHQFHQKKIDNSLYTLLDRNMLRYFGLQKLTLDGFYSLKNHECCCRAGIVIKGEKVMIGNLQLNPGDAFFLPAAISEYDFYGKGQIIMALPPSSH